MRGLVGAVIFGAWSLGCGGGSGDGGTGTGTGTGETGPGAPTSSGTTVPGSTSTGAGSMEGTASATGPGETGMAMTTSTGPGGTSSGPGGSGESGAMTSTGAEGTTSTGDASTGGGTTEVCEETAGTECAEGTCKLAPDGPCEAPMGPLENGCCECMCSVCTVPCKCAAPDTPIATPEGERAIASLRPGDLVLSVEGDAVVVVPVLEVRRRLAPADHVVMRVTLADGEELAISPGHPTADGRVLWELVAGDRLGDAVISAIAPEAYGHAYTHDILPASSTGAYFAAGALVGSTLAPARLSPWPNSCHGGSEMFTTSGCRSVVRASVADRGGST